MSCRAATCRGIFFYILKITFLLFLSTSLFSHSLQAETPGGESRERTSLPVLRSGVPLQVILHGGVVVDGSFISFQSGILRMASETGIKEVELSTVDRLLVEGLAVSIDEFNMALRDWRATIRNLYPRPPSPAMVGALSLLWPGSGHLALGKARSFVGYTVVELGLVGTGVYLYNSGNSAQIIPLLVLDALFRAYAFNQAVRESNRRRRLLLVRSFTESEGMGSIVGWNVPGGSAVPRGDSFIFSN